MEAKTMRRIAVLGLTGFCLWPGQAPAFLSAMAPEMPVPAEVSDMAGITYPTIEPLSAWSIFSETAIVERADGVMLGEKAFLKRKKGKRGHLCLK
jgi:hypothetical protein